MPASRIVFAIGDLMGEVRALRGGEPALGAVELHLDEPTFGAVVGEIENHYGQQLSRDVVDRSVAVEFGGMVIRTKVGT